MMSELVGGLTKSKQHMSAAEQRAAEQMAAKIAARKARVAARKQADLQQRELEEMQARQQQQNEVQPGEAVGEGELVPLGLGVGGAEALGLSETQSMQQSTLDSMRSQYRQALAELAAVHLNKSPEQVAALDSAALEQALEQAGVQVDILAELRKLTEAEAAR